MFGNNKNKEAGKSKNNMIPGSTSHQLNSLTAGTEVEGSLVLKSDIRVDGTITGNLNCSAKVIIGPSGKIKGEVNCQSAVIEGTFEGTLNVTELLNIRESAKVSGEVTYGKLRISAGAVIEGTYTYRDGQKKSNGQSGNQDSKKIVNNSSSTKNIAGQAKRAKETAN